MTLQQAARALAPKRAIVANLSAQKPNNSYAPLLWYEDRPFKCRDCKKPHVWTATQQKWYFEVAKGPIYAKPVRCRACRRKVAEQKAAQQNHMAEMARRKRA